MPRIAIPLPHASDPEYAARSIPQYERAVQLAGGTPVRIPLDKPDAEVVTLIATCDAVVLPGSKADVDPARFSAPRSPRTAAADPRRDAVDDLLLADAYKHRKPVLGICYGLQSLNVFRRGSLIQHIPDFLPEPLRAKINHEAGSKVAVAHSVEIDAGSRLSRIVGGTGAEGIGGLKAASGASAQDCHPEPSAVLRSEGSMHFASAQSAGGKCVLAVNSSHHQSAEKIGEGLRIVARCPDDNIVEALEGTAPDHFVIAVQWHPERSVEEDAASPAIFRALIAATKR